MLQNSMRRHLMLTTDDAAFVTRFDLKDMRSFSPN
jgi:hypothetical protein